MGIIANCRDKMWILGPFWESTEQEITIPSVIYMVCSGRGSRQSNVNLNLCIARRYLHRAMSVKSHNINRISTVRLYNCWLMCCSNKMSPWIDCLWWLWVDILENSIHTAGSNGILLNSESAIIGWMHEERWQKHNKEASYIVIFRIHL